MSTPATDAERICLLLDVDQNAKTGRLGYDFRINRPRTTPDNARIERWTGTAWESIGTAQLQVGAIKLQLAVPRSFPGLTADEPLRFDFKWTDDIPAQADGMDLIDPGDAAPNARFIYRHQARRP